MNYYIVCEVVGLGEDKNIKCFRDVDIVPYLWNFDSVFCCGSATVFTNKKKAMKWIREEKKTQNKTLTLFNFSLSVDQLKLKI